MKIVVTITCILTALGLAGCQYTPIRTSGSVEVVGDHARVSVHFSDHDREVIHQHYRHTKHKKMPPGLAKKNKLPPGLEKQIVKHGKLPPGLEHRHLPSDLERRLDPLPRGYVRIRVGTDIVLMDNATRVVFDVITDVAF